MSWTSSAPRRARPGSRPAAWARSCGEAVAVEDDVLGAPAPTAARSRSQAAQSSRPRSRISVRRRRPARLASSADLAGGALEPRLLLLLERLAGRRLGLLADRLGALEQAPPGSGATSARARRRATQRSASARSSRPRSESRKRARSRSPAASRAAAATSSGRCASVDWTRPSRFGFSTSAESGAKSTGWQREAIVSSSASGSELSRIRWTNSGGSSSVFSSAFWLSSRIASAASIDEDALAAFEGPVGGGADHPLAHLLDQVLGAARRQPDEVGMRRGVEQGAAPGVVGVLGAGGEDLGREGARRGPLAGAPRAPEEVRVRRPRRERRAQRHPRPRLVLGAPSLAASAPVLVTAGKRRDAPHREPAPDRLHHPLVHLLDAAVASITTTRSEAIRAISS